jgi:hypothetical protein
MIIILKPESLSADPDPVTKGQSETDVQLSRRFETLRSQKKL